MNVFRGPWVASGLFVLGMGLAAWETAVLTAHPAAALAVVILGFGILAALLRPMAVRSSEPVVAETLPSRPASLPGLELRNEAAPADLEPAQDPPLAKLAGEARFYRVCLKELGDSTTKNLLTMTTPFSAEILGVQQSIAGFVRKVRDNDEAITSNAATKWIEEKRQGVKLDMDLVAEAVQDGFRGFETNMAALETVMKNVLQTTGKIEDVAQRINVLSINAAIEAARAGVGGRGFKVISDHIRAIAHETSLVIDGIHTTLSKTVGTFQGIDEDLKRKRTRINETLTTQHENFATFYRVFDEHNRKFVDLYQDTMSFVNQLSQTMKAVSPLVQLHEITVQEMQNLSLIQEDFFGEWEDAANLSVRDVRTSDLELLIDRVRQRLTTARELDALESSIRKIGGPAVDLRRSSQTIELF